MFIINKKSVNMYLYCNLASTTLPMMIVDQSQERIDLDRYISIVLCFTSFLNKNRIELQIENSFQYQTT